MAGTDDWTGVGLGNPITRPGKSCLAHRHNGSSPFDYDGADGRTVGGDAISGSDGARFSGFLDHIFLWVLQTSPPAHRR